MKLGCILMAAGSGSRFGSNKLLALFRGRPLYRWALEAVPAGRFTTVVVSGCEEILEAAEAKGFLTAKNERPEEGVSRTIRLGMEQLEGCDGILFLTADQPLLSSRTVEQVAEAFLDQPDCIWAAGHEGKKGNPCLFPRLLFPELLQLQGDRGGSRVIRAHMELLRLVETPAAELADCDTAEALQALEQDETGQVSIC